MATTAPAAATGGSTPSGGGKERESFAAPAVATPTSSQSVIQPAEASLGVLKKGLMLKQGAVVKSWKERFFVLLKDRIVYLDPTEWDPTRPHLGVGKAKGVLMLSDVKTVSPLRSRGAFQIAVAANASSGVLSRDYLVVAASDTERKVWMEAIQKAMFAPSKVAQLMKQAGDLQRTGQLCTRQVACIRGWLTSAKDDDLERAGDMLRRAESVSREERGSDEMENALVDVQFADSESDLLRTLQALKHEVESADTTPSFRDRLVEIAMEQYSSSADKLAAALEEEAKVAQSSGGSSSAPVVSMYGGMRHKVCVSLRVLCACVSGMRHKVCRACLSVCILVVPCMCVYVCAGCQVDLVRSRDVWLVAAHHCGAMQRDSGASRRAPNQLRLRLGPGWSTVSSHGGFTWYRCGWWGFIW